jgi:hypothetical protein
MDSRAQYPLVATARSLFKGANGTYGRAARMRATDKEDFCETLPKLVAPKGAREPRRTPRAYGRQGGRSRGDETQVDSFSSVTEALRATAG